MIDWLRFVTALIEVITITWTAHYILCLIWNQRVRDISYGIGLITLVYAFSYGLDLFVLQILLENLFKLTGVALLILFQPEIRMTLSKLGSRGLKYQEVTEFDGFVEGIAQSIYYLAEKRIGALILIENQDTLDEFANKAVYIGANFSSELLESIFMPSTPLHDGAVIIRGTQILSAATILPLAEDIGQVAKSMGTRHRAGLGISQRTDSLVIVISEETGRISLAIDGIMTRGVKIDRFRSILRSVFTHPQIKKRRFGWYKR